MSFLKAGTLEDLRARYMVWRIQAKIFFPKIIPQERSTQGLSYYRMLYKLFCFEQKVLSGKGTLSENDLSASLDVLAVTQWLP